MKSFICILFSTWMLMFVGIFSAFPVFCQDVDADFLKNVWIPQFKQNLKTFAEKVLKADKIKQEMDDNLKDNFVKTLDGSDEFSRVLGNISVRLTRVSKALTDFKLAIENELRQTVSHAALPLPYCCLYKNLHNYVGRLRQSAVMSQICVGTRDSEFFYIGIKDSFNILKENYDNVSAILWQYFSTVEGHFVQYPTYNRHCDKQGNLISPLTEKWFVDKLFMEQKNLVIVFDIGQSTQIQLNGSTTLNDLIQKSVQEALQTLTPNDRVNVVAFNNTVYVPDGCQHRLFIANQKNLDYISNFVSSIRQPAGASDLLKALEMAYSLFLMEKQTEPSIYIKMTNVLVVITPGNLTNLNTENLFSSISTHQQKLDHKIVHIVYMVRPSNQEPLQQNLSSIQEVLNDVAMQGHPAWPLVLNLTGNGQPVGPNGQFSLITDVYNLANKVATYYKVVSPLKTDSATIIAPIEDTFSGLIMTLSVPVYNSTNTGVYGVAAIDVSMATIFAEALNFDVGVHSYMFVLENRHGHVLLHPKLADPTENIYDDPIYPPLEAIEPLLTQDQRNKLISATASPGQNFFSKVQPGRNTFISDVVESIALVNATVWYQNIYGTQFVVVLVWFLSDRDLQVPKDFGKDVRLHAPYHRLDQLHMSPASNKPDDATVCFYSDSYIAPSESTIKLAPTVFKEPEKYKYSKETLQQVMDLNRFLEHSKVTSLIRPEIEDEIQHFLRATNNTDSLWRDAAKDALERFLATLTGVLRVFPGMPMNSQYNHMHYQWFKKSCSLPEKLVISSGRFSHFIQSDVILMSKALSENMHLDGSQVMAKQLQAVAAATVTHRQLTAMLFNDAPHCTQGNIQCHLVDSAGYMLTYGDDIHGVYNVHMTKKFPWLSSLLIRRKLLMPVWCTSLSKGDHELSYTLTLTFDQDDSKTRPCRQYAIGAVDGTNLFLLVLVNRTKHSCRESEQPEDNCVNSDHTSGPLIRCQQCVHPYDPLHCEHPCICAADFDQCSSQFSDLNATWFPERACFSHDWSPVPEHLKPSVPPRSLKPCFTPCIVKEIKEECEKFAHCRWKTEDRFPLCVWRNSSQDHTQTTHSSHLSTNPDSVDSTVTSPTTNPQNLSTVSQNGKTSHVTDSSEMVTNFQSSAGPQHQISSAGVTAPSSGVISTKLVTQVSLVSSNTAKTVSPWKSSAGISTNLSPDGKLTTPVDVQSASVPSSTSGITKEKPSSSSTDSSDSGWIAGLVVAVLVVVVVLGFIIWKFYIKKFRQAGTNRPASKYLPRINIFDGAVFKSGTDQAVLTSSVPTSTSTPYHKLN